MTDNKVLADRLLERANNWPTVYGSDRDVIECLREAAEALAREPSTPSAQVSGGGDGFASLADQLVADWDAAGRMPQMAWDFRGFAVDGMKRAIALHAPQARPDADRVLKDALFACIAEGHTSRRYGGVAYQGGHASVVFSVEPTEQARPDGGEARLTALRAAQAEAVMPLIGPLLDAWEGACNDDKEVMREAGVAERIEAINERMENHPDPAPTPAPDAVAGIRASAAPPPPAEQASGEWSRAANELRRAEALANKSDKIDRHKVIGKAANNNLSTILAALSQRPVVLNSENLTGDDLGCISAPAVSGAAFKWDHVETERRKAAFNAWVRTQANKQGFRLMPPGYQGAVHGMLRMAFYAGSNWQRRHGTKAPQQPTGEETATVTTKNGTGRNDGQHEQA